MVGDAVTIKNNVLLWDGVTVETRVFGPNVVFTNDPQPRAASARGREAGCQASSGGDATTDANATVVCGVTIVRFAFVGAGSMVTADVPDHALMVGNPAHQGGRACECGLKLGHDLDCACGRTYELAGGRLTLGA